MSIDTKTALLDVAEHAARARGFDGFSYADLAEAVGIRKASIHYHFPTKAALSGALVDRYHRTLETECVNIAATYDTGADQLRAIIRLYRDALSNGRTLCLCVSLISSRESLSGEVLEKIRVFRTMMAKRVQTVFELGLTDKSISGVENPASEALATLALLEGAHLAARAEGCVQPFDDAVKLLELRGCSSP